MYPGELSAPSETLIETFPVTSPGRRYISGTLFSLKVIIPVYLSTPFKSKGQMLGFPYWCIPPGNILGDISPLFLRC